MCRYVFGEAPLGIFFLAALRSLIQIKVLTAALQRLVDITYQSWRQHANLHDGIYYPAEIFQNATHYICAKGQLLSNSQRQISVKILIFKCVLAIILKFEKSN